MDPKEPAPLSRSLSVDCSVGQQPSHRRLGGVTDVLLSVDERFNRLQEQLWRSRSEGSSGATKSPRVRLLYTDERIRDRFCANAQRLLDAVLEDPGARSKSSLIAHKALRYRKITNRLQEVDPRDPAFDVSAFFGVEWRRKDIAVKADELLGRK